VRCVRVVTRKWLDKGVGAGVGVCGPAFVRGSVVCCSRRGHAKRELVGHGRSPVGLQEDDARELLRSVVRGGWTRGSTSRSWQRRVVTRLRCWSDTGGYPGDWQAA